MINIEHQEFVRNYP